MLLCLLKAIYHDIVIVHQPKLVPLSASIVNGILHAGGCNGCVLPPSLVEDILPVPEYFDTLASLDFVQFGSGPMSRASGDSLLSRQRNCPHFIGSSEVGLLPLLELEDPVDDWQYFHFHPWGGIDMRPIEGGDDTLRQLFINRVANEVGLQPVFELFPEIEEWDTRELYSRHPTKPYLWRCIGRADDIIVLSNGEKLNPSDTEGALSNCIPEVKGALVVGSGYFMPGLILETADCNPSGPEERKRLLDSLRPTLAAVNERAPKHGQLMESMIHFTTADKPFFRTPKLSVIRQKTVESFSDEITQMYARQEAQSLQDVFLPVNIDLTTDASTQEFFVGIIMHCTGWDRAPQPDEDLFLLGLDSLHVMRLVRATTVALGRERSSTQLRFDSRIVYENLSVKKLSKALQSLLSQSSSANGRQEVSATLMEEEIDALVEKMSTFDWDSTTFDKLPLAACSESTVVLTGSTGSFGTYLLSVLVNDASVRRIYCLDRAADAEARHIKSLSSQGLPCDLRVLKEKAVFLKTSDISSPYLGLNQHRYETLTQTVSHVVHNAWPVNFNLSLESFMRSINGVQRLVEFCVSTKNTSKLAFVSSISSVARCKGTVPSTVVQDSTVAGKMGYAQSKHTAERILLAATERSAMLSQHGTSLQTVVLRVGQIAGPVAAPDGKGVWTTREWFPRLVISSKMIDALPQSLGRMDGVDWIPIDLLAKVVGELVGLSSPTDSQDSRVCSSTYCTEVYNLVNPTTVSAKELLPTVKERLGITNMVSLSDWIDRVRGWPAEEDIPAAKILDFYESLVLPEGEYQHSKTFDLRNAVASSKTMRELSPVTGQWVEGWLRQWGF